MTSITLFQKAQFTIAVVFAIFISDHRKKNKMFPLVNEKFTLAMKLCYLIPICIYGYTLVTLDRLLAVDFFALACTFIGTLLVVKAKADLAEYHTWTGYCSETPRFVTTGIYAFVRHPLYTGIYLFIFGTANVIAHVPWYLTLVALINLAYIMIFILWAATKETQYLTQRFGGEFLKYKQQVHPFLPLRKFQTATSQVSRNG